MHVSLDKWVHNPGAQCYSKIQEMGVLDSKYEVTGTLVEDKFFEFL